MRLIDSLFHSSFTRKKYKYVVKYKSKHKCVVNILKLETSTKRSKIMKSIKSSNTSIELCLRKALWHNGIRYRKNLKVLDCHPDIVITKYRIAIFCDGVLWHGKEMQKRSVKHNASYWNMKIRRNVERDLENTIELRDNGWIVLRFWEDEIQHNLEKCINEVLKYIFIRKNSGY